MWTHLAQAQFDDIHLRLYQATSNQEQITSDKKSNLYKQFISTALDISLEQIEVVRGDFLKPKVILKNSPDDIFLSSSDSGNYILLAVSKNIPIGVDLEVHRDAVLDFDLLIESSFTDLEKKYMTQTSLEKKINMFYEIWTKKEALIKAADLSIENLKNIEVLQNNNPKIGFIDIGVLLPQKNMSASLCYSKDL